MTKSQLSIHLYKPRITEPQLKLLQKLTGASTKELRELTKQEAHLEIKTLLEQQRRSARRYPLVWDDDEHDHWGGAFGDDFGANYYDE